MKYNGRSQNYYGKQLTVNLDGEECRADGTKALILNNTVMGSCTDIFKKAFDAKVTYNSKSGKIVIKDNGVTVKLKTGSKNIYINGRKSKLSQAPVKVRYVKKNKTKLLVPVKIIAKALGYTYVYNKTENKIDLTSPFILIYNDRYNVYKSYFGGMVFDNTTIDISDMPFLKIGGTVMMPADLVFNETMGITYMYDSQTGYVNIINDFYDLQMNTANKIAVLTDLKTNESKEISLKHAPVLVKRKDTGYSDMMVPAAAVMNAMGYYYKWDSLVKVCNIHTKTYFDWKQNDQTYDNTLYSNALTELNTFYDMDSNAVVLSLNFACPVDSNLFVITQDNVNNYLYIDFAGQINLVSGNSYTMSGPNIDVISSEQTATGGRVALSLHNNVSYYHSVVNNVINVYISEEWDNDYGMRISKPDNVSFDQFSLEDRYYENKFVISVPGNYVDYFDNNPVQNNSSAISSFDIDFNKNFTTITVNTKKLQGCKLVNLGNMIGVIVDDPHNVFENIVVLDPGHGGKDPGAQSNHVNESDCNYTILYTYAKEYFNSPDSPVKAYWTRVDDTYITLDDRAKFASKVDADMFVSLHMNSASSSAAKGTEVYYCQSNNSSNSFGLTSNKLAIKCLYKITPALSTAVRGVKSANYYVIKYNSVPSVLIELAFMSNSSDLKIITNQTSQKLAAKAIYEAVVESFNTDMD